MNVSSRTALLVGAAAALVLVVPVRGQQEEPRELGLREETGRRLVQLDVSVTGPDEAIRSLTKADLELSVAGVFVDDFTLDRICREPAGARAGAAENKPAVPDSVPTAVVPAEVTPATFLFYFDQPFLTMEGRNRGLEIARELIPQLITDGARATIISSGQVVTTYADMETDVPTLLAAIDEIENDKRQWDPTAISEETRINEVLRELRDRGTDQAAAMARRYQADERWRTEKALRKFSMAIGRLADLEPPKAVVYFADRMRSKPGEHFLSYFSRRQQIDSRVLENMGIDIALGSFSFDRVVNEANAFGARMYTVQAEGITGMSITQTPGVRNAGTRHITDAQSSLVSLARETGGESFLRGVGADKIAQTIEEELSCLYLISFDAEGFKRDTALPVRLVTRKPKVKVDTRGQVYIQSDEARLTSRLMAAFAAPDAMKGEGQVYGAVIPTGFADGEFTALVQVSLEGSALPTARWDIGASLVSRGAVREDASTRLEVAGSGTPVVFETEMKFGPGPFELALVAHELSADRVLTGRIEGEFPDIDEQPASVAPIAVMQPATAVFLRDGEVKRQGALGQERRQLLQTDRPTALISLVCRSKGTKGALHVERRLIGESEAPFPEMNLDLGKDRCAQVRDVISAGTMTDGEFTYEVKVLHKDEELATSERAFSAATTASDASLGS